MSWIIIFLILMFAATFVCHTMWFFDEYLGVVIMAAVLLWPAHWLYEAIDHNFDAQIARTEANHQRWYADKIAHGCKRTGFAGRFAEPIWTCPDGTAYKEFSQ